MSARSAARRGARFSRCRGGRGSSRACGRASPSGSCSHAAMRPWCTTCSPPDAARPPLANRWRRQDHDARRDARHRAAARRIRRRCGRVRSAVLRGADLGSQDAANGRLFELYGAVSDRICAGRVHAAACRMESAGRGQLRNLPDDSAGHLALSCAPSSRGEDSMIPDLISTLIAIVLVCVTVLDQRLLDSQHGLLLVAGIALSVLGVIANRVDYLKWPGIAIAAAGIAIMVLVASGLSSASSETAFWVVFWSGNIAGLMSLWSALYRGPRASSDTAES